MPSEKEGNVLTLLRDYLIILITVQVLVLVAFGFWLRMNPPKSLIIAGALLIAVALAIVWPIALGLAFERWKGYRIRLKDRTRA
jgi:membrane protein YdbS with pleckstrin-like domain